MHADDDDPIWNAFVTAVLRLAAVDERRSRYADKPALWLDGREIAHLEAPGVIDLRITRAGWSQLSALVRSDAAVRHDPSRRDWLELQLDSVAAVERLAAVVAAAVRANRRPDRT